MLCSDHSWNQMTCKMMSPIIFVIVCHTVQILNCLREKDAINLEWSNDLEDILTNKICKSSEIAIGVQGWHFTEQKIGKLTGTTADQLGPSVHNRSDAQLCSTLFSTVQYIFWEFYRQYFLIIIKFWLLILSVTLPVAKLADVSHMPKLLPLLPTVLHHG